MFNFHTEFLENSSQFSQTIRSSNRLREIATCSIKPRYVLDRPTTPSFALSLLSSSGLTDKYIITVLHSKLSSSPHLPIKCALIFQRLIHTTAKCMLERHNTMRPHAKILKFNDLNKKTCYLFDLKNALKIGFLPRTRLFSFVKAEKRVKLH